jgi:hypothetical protein
MEESSLLLLEILKITLPALIVAGAMYMVIKNYQEKDYKTRLIELRKKNVEIVLPIRLQAYERVVLFLERISPSSLLIRVSSAGQSAIEYHRLLLAEIRNEFNHNMSQQVYMTEQAWQQVKHAREETLNLINRTFQELPENAKGTDLAKKILESIVITESDPTARAISFIKQEIGQVF